MQLGDLVIARTGAGRHEGKIVGRTLEGEQRFDVRSKGKILVNVPIDYIELKKGQDQCQKKLTSSKLTTVA